MTVLAPLLHIALADINPPCTALVMLAGLEMKMTAPSGIDSIRSISVRRAELIAQSQTTRQENENRYIASRSSRARRTCRGGRPDVLHVGELPLPKHYGPHL